jgi:hypothetical protein
MDRKFILLLLIKINHYGHMVVQYVEMFVCLFVCFVLFSFTVNRLGYVGEMNFFYLSTITFLPGIKRLSVMLTTVLHLGPRLIMRGAIPPLLHTSLWCSVKLSISTSTFISSLRFEFTNVLFFVVISNILLWRGRVVFCGHTYIYIHTHTHTRSGPSCWPLHYFHTPMVLVMVVVQQTTDTWLNVAYFFHRSG